MEAESICSDPCIRDVCVLAPSGAKPQSPQCLVDVAGLRDALLHRMSLED